jgi:hypothetical protein
MPQKAAICRAGPAEPVSHDHGHTWQPRCTGRSAGMEAPSPPTAWPSLSPATQQDATQAKVPDQASDLLHLACTGKNDDLYGQSRDAAVHKDDQLSDPLLLYRAACCTPRRAPAASLRFSTYRQVGLGISEIVNCWVLVNALSTCHALVTATCAQGQQSSQRESRLAACGAVRQVQLAVTAPLTLHTPSLQEGQHTAYGCCVLWADAASRRPVASVRRVAHQHWLRC